MDTVLKFRGREVRPHDLDFIRDILAASPKTSRRALSFKLCEAWGWAQPNGAPCDALCRALMLQLHRTGHLVLPPPRWRSRQPRRHAVVTKIDVVPVPLTASIATLGPLDIRQVRRTPDEDLVKSLVQEHHYLGYVHPVGEHLKYLVSAGGQPIACFCWSSAPRHLGPRDRHIGWSPAARKANIRFVAYQSRFLILPWVKVPHLASHLLGAISRRLSADWEHVYAHPIYFTETFVDPDRFRGTCYRAANWTVLGMTLGVGKDARTRKPNRSLKQLLGYPLVKEMPRTSAPQATRRHRTPSRPLRRRASARATAASPPPTTALLTTSLFPTNLSGAVTPAGVASAASSTSSSSPHRFSASSAKPPSSPRAGIASASAAPPAASFTPRALPRRRRARSSMRPPSV